MRAQHQLLHSRARVRPRYAVMPLEGYPVSRLPHWSDAEARVLASPALGAQFVEYLLDVPANSTMRHEADGQVEAFFYVLSGKIELTVDGKSHALGEGGYALVPHTASYQIRAGEATRLLLLRKRYEPAPGFADFPLLIGDVRNVKAEVYMGDEGALLQTLIPDDLRYDMAMNIFAFQPGHSLPVVETHVMEHGLLFLQGKGLYYLDGEWMEVETDDFIWMGPYCPQSFYATGPVPAKYLYYKNVNREIAV